MYSKMTSFFAGSYKIGLSFVSRITCFLFIKLEFIILKIVLPSIAFRIHFIARKRKHEQNCLKE